MELDKLGEEMKETGTHVLLSVDPDTGNFMAELMCGNYTVMASTSPDLTEALRDLLPVGSIDRYYCGWSIKDVQTLEPTMSAEDATGVMQLMSRKADASLGFAWDTLTHYIEVKERWAV